MIGSFLFGIGALIASGASLRPPAVPLAVNDPHLSLWSPADNLTDAETMHWSRDAQPLSIVGEAGGRMWRFCGKEPASIPAARQRSVRVGCTETVYAFDAGGTPVELRFSTPLLPGEWEVFSRPVTYLTVKGAKAKVAISPAFATDDDAAEMVTNQMTVAGCPAVSIGRKAQPKPQGGDRVRPNGGYFWLLDAGDHFLLAYDSVFDFSFLGKRVPAWWRRGDGPCGGNFTAMLERAVSDYPRLMRRMAAFDAEMRERFVRAGGVKYADMAELAWRQSFGAGKLAAAPNGEMLFFSKENTSNGCIATVDILYPQLPHLMLGGVELAKAAIRPDMLYASSSAWPYPYAPHDLGAFPFADGQRYGMGPDKADADRMPVEESGNLIIALYAVARLEGHADFAGLWWPTVVRWAAYLRQFGFDPENQLCTDDFAGHLAHNANLSLKTLTAFEAFARLAGMRGDTVEAKTYHALAADGAKAWVLRAQGGKDGATVLAFGAPDTWSLKYNLAFAKALGIDLFPSEITRREVAAYLKNVDAYGIPLDSRKRWCKVDWLVWCATLAENRRDFEAMVAPTWKFLNETTERVAFPDLYYTENAMCTRYGREPDRFIGFNARPVVGGVYLPLVCGLKSAVATPALSLTGCAVVPGIPDGVVDVTTLGARNDASADVSVIVNAATEKSALYFPPGRYLVEKPLHLRHSIYGKGFSRCPDKAKGDPVVDSTRTWFISKIECEDGSKSIVEFGEFRNINVEEINFMCHSRENAVRVLPGKPGDYAFLSKLGIYQLGGTGISVECNGSRPVFIQDISIWGSTRRYCEGSCGILVCAPDCRLSNIEVMAAQIGFDLRSGYTYGENMHLWTGCMAKSGDKVAWWKGTRGVRCSSGAIFVGSNIYPDTCYHPFEFTGKSAVVDIRGIMYWDDRSERGCADHNGALLKCDGVEDPCLKIDGGFWGVCGSDADPHWMKYLYNPKLDIRNVTVRSQMDVKGANLDTLCMNTTLPDYRVSYATNAFCKVAEIFTTEKTGSCEATLTLDDGAAWRLVFQKNSGYAAKMTTTPLNDLCFGRELTTGDGDGTLKVFLKAGAPFAGRFTTTRMTPRFRPVDFGNLRTHGGEIRYRECR